MSSCRCADCWLSVVERIVVSWSKERPDSETGTKEVNEVARDVTRV